MYPDPKYQQGLSREVCQMHTYFSLKWLLGYRSLAALGLLDFSCEKAGGIVLPIQKADVKEWHISLH